MSETVLSGKVKEPELIVLNFRCQLQCRMEGLSHEDLSNHYCVDWLKAHEAHYSRAKTLEIADLTGIPQRSIMGPTNYRPLKEMGSPGLMVEPLKHRTGIARTRVAIQAQFRRWTRF